MIRTSEPLVFCGGRQRCAACGHAFDAIWPIAALAVVDAMQCEECGAMASRLDGPATIVDGSADARFVAFSCSESLRVRRAAEVARVKES